MNSPDWNILYRGSLSSCNYACAYCPFAKTENTREELAIDKAELQRFCDWLQARSERAGVLFTPWGEALIRSYYRQAMLRLSHADNISRVAIQTNMSCSVDWIQKANLDTIAFWITFHPGETKAKVFIDKCLALADMGVRHSVGVVGLREHFKDIEMLREALPEKTYLWVNAYKREPDYYQNNDIALLKTIDPYFDYNRRYHASQNNACSAGHRSFTVNGNGDAFRCHFIPNKIGNIYNADFAKTLAPKPCSITHCGCHIGYVHLKKMDMSTLFGDGLLERIPQQWPKVDTRFTDGPLEHHDHYSKMRESTLVYRSN